MLVHLFADGGTCTLNTFPQRKSIKVFDLVHQQSQKTKAQSGVPLRTFELH
jgi:hypothetical protein